MTLTLNANHLSTVGAPLSLSHDAILPYQHNADEHTDTCRAFGGRVVKLRTGQEVTVSLTCRQASQMLGYLIAAADLNGEEALLESLCYEAAKVAAVEAERGARYRWREAEREATFARRDSYHYEEVAERAAKWLEGIRLFLGDLLYDEAVAMAPTGVREAA